MKIIHVISKLAAAGAESVAINIAVEHAKKFDVIVVSLLKTSANNLDVASWQETLLDDAKVKLVKLNLPSTKWVPLLAPIKLARIFKDKSPDLVHSHTDIPDMAVSLTSRIIKLKLARTIHSTSLWSTHSKLGHLSERAFIDELVIAIGKDTKNSYIKLRKSFNLPISKYIETIKNGVREPDIRKSREELCKDHKLNSSKFQIGYFGRLTQEKGVDVLLDAISYMQETNFEVSIFGDGYEKDALMSKAKNMPVTFFDPVPNAPAFMAGFDIIVLPSRFEGLPLVSLEAQMVGTPVLITDAPGLRESVLNEWPLVVANESPDKLADMMTRVIKGEFDLELLSLQSNTWVKKFSVANMAKEYGKSYISFLNKKTWY